MIRSFTLFDFQCDCFACENDLKQNNFICKNPKLLHELIEKSEIAHKKVKKTKDQLKENWKVISAYHEDPLSVEVPELIKENTRMVKDLECAASFPC